jgi:hypothetical protein
MHLSVYLRSLTQETKRKAFKELHEQHNKYNRVPRNTPFSANVLQALHVLFRIASERIALTGALDQGTKGK